MSAIAASDALETLARQSQEALSGVMAWARGAGIAHLVPGFGKSKDGVLVTDDARVDYLLAFPDDAQLIVEKLVDRAQGKHGLLLSERDVCMTFARMKEGLFLGKVVDVDVERGVALQSVGQGRATLHCLADLGRVPEVGQSMEVSYRAGRAVEKSREVEAPLGRLAGVGR